MKVARGSHQNAETKKAEPFEGPANFRNRSCPTGGRTTRGILSMTAKSIDSNSLPIQAALAYAANYGLPVFPCALMRRPNGKLDKVPLVKWGKTEADRAAVDARNLTLIEKWWRRWPDAVISIPTGKRSGIDILDIDCKNGAWGFDTLDELGKSILPDTPISHTPSGGVHVFFSCIDLEIRNSAGEKGLGVGLDIRGEGGQVVLPSPNSGYWWDPHKNLDTVPLRPAPAWLGYRPPKQRVFPQGGRRGFDPEAILAEACANIRTADAGHRHEVLNSEVFSIAGLVASGAINENQARHHLSAAALAMVSRTGGDQDKTERDFAAAFADGLAQPRRARR